MTLVLLQLLANDAQIHANNAHQVQSVQVVLMVIIWILLTINAKAARFFLVIVHYATKQTVLNVIKDLL